VPGRFRRSGRAAQRDQHLSDRTRLAVGHHQRLASYFDAAIQSCEQGFDGVDHVGAVDQGGAGPDQRQPSVARPIDHSGNQLGVTWTPHQVWAHSDHGELAVIGAQRDLLRGGLASRVGAASGDRVGRICTAADQRGA
jgi:hypothetical protein